MDPVSLHKPMAAFAASLLFLEVDLLSSSFGWRLLVSVTALVRRFHQFSQRALNLTESSPICHEICVDRIDLKAVNACLKQSIDILTR